MVRFVQLWNPFRLMGVDENPLINAYSGLNDEDRESLKDVFKRADEQMGFSFTTFTLHDPQESVLTFSCP